MVKVTTIAELEGRDAAIANFQANGGDIDNDSNGGNEDPVLQHQSRAQIYFICGWTHVIPQVSYHL
jgi:hypothetical protein